MKTRSIRQNKENVDINLTSSPQMTHLATPKLSQDKKKSEKIFETPKQVTLLPSPHSTIGKKTIIHQQLQETPLHSFNYLADKIIESFCKAKKVIFILGAGISVSSGIPDFRSENGIFMKLKEKYPSIKNGKDLFNANLFKDADTRKIFFTFMAEFKQLVDKCQPTKAHDFISFINQKKSMLRCYTQNIDGLEEKAGLNDKELIYLHGTIHQLACTLCSRTFDFNKDFVKQLKEGETCECPKCSELSDKRVQQQKRALPIGQLRPDVVLYNEHHRKGDWIGEEAMKDLKKKPDLICVLGTSLKIPGLKKLVKDFSKNLAPLGKQLPQVILINKEVAVGQTAEWRDIFDAVWVGESDSITSYIQQQVQSRLEKKQLKKQVQENQKKRESQLFQPKIDQQFTRRLRSVLKETVKQEIKEPVSKIVDTSDAEEIEPKHHTKVLISFQHQKKKDITVQLKSVQIKQRHFSPVLKQQSLVSPKKKRI